MTPVPSRQREASLALIRAALDCRSAAEGRSATGQLTTLRRVLGELRAAADRLERHLGDQLDQEVT
jgi:hypothetical protein